MKLKRMMLVTCATLLSVGLICTTIGCAEKERCRWIVHDMSRPRPPVVTPGEQPGQPPSHAIILFDGTDLARWKSTKDGGPAKWEVEKGYMQVVKKTGGIVTKDSFGSCHLHIEWAIPSQDKGNSQEGGNSGVFLMDNYEVQVLNSYKNKTYADGQAAAIYGQSPPIVNASRPPEQWQSYDIIFHRPVFKGKKVARPATITVLHNGVLVQDNFQIEGATVWKKRAKYTPHADKLPIRLQDHGSAVRFRNIWLVELP